MKEAEVKRLHPGLAAGGEARALICLVPVAQTPKAPLHFALYHDEETTPVAREETRHAARDRGPRRSSAGTTPRSAGICPRCSATYAVKANPEPGHRPHALQGRRELRRGVAAGVHAGVREHQAPPGQGSSRISSGTRSSTPIRPSRRKRCRRWTNTSRWSPTTTWPSCRRSGNTRRTPAWCCACAWRTPVRNANCPPSSAAIRARRWT